MNKYKFILVSLFSTIILIILSLNFKTNNQNINSSTTNLFKKYTFNISQNENNLKESKARNAIQNNYKNDYDTPELTLDKAIEERDFWINKIKSEQIEEKLNQNNLSVDERNEYTKIYLKLSELDSFIYKTKMKSLEAKVDQFEDEHNRILKNFEMPK
ncbi:hypothetical protein [Silvanigrella aquatica]|uniref:Uncharacterized protein n=1 Tax=Silvanigrella aquatica TaxID=1915309 RepID=A0A1L4D3N6_9BACT|nr:hypothetical protein [Silvanigrella aquatica]APJ04823.1 hypothetical protein AXG55_13310 [Silvanigrella aquatica]